MNIFLWILWCITWFVIGYCNVRILQIRKENKRLTELILNRPIIKYIDKTERESE